MAGSCGTAWRPAAVGEPGAQRRTRNVTPTRAVALRGANSVWMWMNGGAVMLRNVARWVIRVCWPAVGVAVHVGTRQNELKGATTCREGARCICGGQHACMGPCGKVRMVNQ